MILRRTTSRGLLAAALVLVGAVAVVLIVVLRSNAPSSGGLLGLAPRAPSPALTHRASPSATSTPARASGAGPSVPPTGSASSDPTTTGAEPASAPTPRATPPGTPGPIPDVAIATSAQIDRPPPAPDATATPAPQPGLWRIDGYVVDQGMTPLAGVCVVIGPRGCQPYSPKTDDRGYWYIDIAEGQANFDFYFERPGYKTVWLHVRPTGPTEYDVILEQG